MLSESPPKQRYHLLDLVRLMSMIPIVIFHVYESAIYEDRMIFGSDQALYYHLFYYLNPLSFSGFPVLFLSAFFYGRRERTTRSWLLVLGFLAFGNLLMAWAQGEGGFLSLYWEWDIYAYLCVSFASGFLIRRSPALIYTFGALGFFMLWVPIWNFGLEFWISEPWTNPLIGVCDGRAGWPVFPWIGLFWMGFAVGRWTRNPAVRKTASTMSRTEKALWAIALLASVPLLGGYGGVPMGPNYGCFAFRRPPEVFWAHFVWVFFALRVSMIERVNEKLSKLRFARWVSDLQWSRSFGICYAIHLLFLGLIGAFGPFFRENPLMLDLAALLVIPATETVARLGRKLRSDRGDA